MQERLTNKIKKDLIFNLYLLFGLVISGSLIFHPDVNNAFDEFGSWKWWLVACGIFGLTLAIAYGTFLYSLLFRSTIERIVSAIKKREFLDILLTSFQFLLIIGMTWPLPMLLAAAISKLYFNYEIKILLLP